MILPRNEGCVQTSPTNPQSWLSWLCSTSWLVGWDPESRVVCRFGGEKTCWGERMLRMIVFLDPLEWSLSFLLGGFCFYGWMEMVLQVVGENKKERVVVLWGQKCGERQKEERQPFCLKKKKFVSFLFYAESAFHYLRG